MLVLIADAHHERRLSVQQTDYHRPAKGDPRYRAREAHENQPGNNREQKDAAHDFDHADHMAVQRLRIHVAVADSGQCLYTEEETIIKPLSTRGAGDAVALDSVKRGKQQVERNVKSGDQRPKLRPPQSEQPLINVSRLPAANIDFDKLDLTGVDGNAVSLPFR